VDSLSLVVNRGWFTIITLGRWRYPSSKVRNTRWILSWSSIIHQVCLAPNHYWTLSCFYHILSKRPSFSHWSSYGVGLSYHISFDTRRWFNILNMTIFYISPISWKWNFTVTTVIKILRWFVSFYSVRLDTMGLCFNMLRSIFVILVDLFRHIHRETWRWRRKFII